MKFYLLTLMIFLLGAAQLSITIISIYQQATVMNRFTVRQTVSAAVWDSLNFDEKVKFIDLWIIFTTIGNISQILGCLNILIVGNVTLSVNETVIGIGCFCSWICIIQFLKPNDHSYTVIDTLSRAYKRLGPYICGVLPIFMGFVFLAMCLFWKTGNYTSVTGAMLVNFAMLNGDTLNGFMSQAISVSGFFGQIYMYAYILFFLW